MTGEAFTPTLAIDEIGRRWLDACADAGIEPDAEARLALIDETRPESASLAFHFDPGTTIYEDDLYPLTDSQRELLNRPGIREAYRLAVFTRVAPRLLSGLMRHELQHARQYRAFPAAYRTTSLANDSMSLAYGSRPGSGVLYNATPLEQDANVAAARFLGRLDGDPTQEELASDQAQLFLITELPWGEDDLPVETLAFLALHPDEVEQLVEERPGTMESLLKPLHPGGVGIWTRLRQDRELQSLRDQARLLVPGDHEIAAAGDRPAEAWRPLADALVVARSRARAVIHS